MARINLLVNPSFRQGLPGWTPVAGATIAIAADKAWYGTDSLRVVKSANAGSGVTTTDFITVEPLKPYSLSGYSWVDLGDPAADLALKVSWYNSANTLISENTTTTVTVLGSGGWERITGVYSSPGAAVKAKVSAVQLSAGSAGADWYIDAMLFEQSSYVGEFIDNLTQSQENAIVNRGLTPLPAPVTSGMQLNADIAIGNLVLNTIDESNTLWVCTDIDGWWGQAMPEIPDITRGVDDGSYDVTGRYQARQMALSGVFIPSSAAGLGAARDRLVEATNLVRRGVWLRTNEQPTRAAFVRLSGLPKIQTTNARGRTEFVIGLKAADPIKYLWNDADPDGFTTVDISGLGGTGMVINSGTADVTAVFTLTGPLGLNSTIYNAATDETMEIVQPLRGANAVATVTNAELVSEQATLTTSAPHNLRIGDIINVSGVGAPFDSVNETFIVTAASDVVPYTVSYYRQAIDRPPASVNGSVGLANNDVLEINTYERSVKFNGEIVGHRSKLETLVDWIRLSPGINMIHLDDSIDESVILKKSMTNGVAELTSAEAHFLSPGDTVTVSLPELALLKRKSLTSNVATLTTEENHGFSIGDTVNVDSTTISDVVNKVLTSNVATLTTALDGGFVVGDSITVALPTIVQPNTKSVTSNVVTLTTATPHGFSVGDSVTVALPTSANVTTKALNTNAVTIGTSGSHGYSIGDTVVVTLPSTANITNKSVSGNSVTLTTSPAHGFSVNDSFTVSLPTSSVLVAPRSMGGSPTYLATITTTSPHNFAVGDRINVDLNVGSNATVTQRASSGTTRTLTVSAPHGFVVGERITVSSMTANYVGSFVIASVPTTTTLTYTSTSFTESSVATSGLITNDTIATGYNGNKIIESVTSTTISYLSYSDSVASSGGAVGGAGSVFNSTNSGLNGTYPIAAVPSSTSIQYTKA
jgi:hypothetical protein